MTDGSDRVIFAFDQSASIGCWYSINDTVMGGVSVGQFLATEDGTAVFAGVVSLENNGGFASVRSDSGIYDLRGYAGIRLAIQGDGRRYKLSLKTDIGLDGVQYQAAFATEEGAWQTTDLGFGWFAPTFRGRSVDGAPPLDVSAIRTFGLMISERQAGSFRLELRSIVAYRD